jgi:predicted site-specific integrase-resolvase
MATLRTMPAVYTIAEACAVAGIRRTTLYKEIRSGDLRPSRSADAQSFWRTIYVAGSMSDSWGSP